MKWIEALKLYNKGKGMWCIAKKGTPEYDEVKKIMNRDKAPAVAERNKERSQKSLEQLKGEASKSEARRAEARKKYEEKVKDRSHPTVRAPRSHLHTSAYVSIRTRRR